MALKRCGSEAIGSMSNQLRSPSLQEQLVEDIPTLTKLGLHTCLPGRVVSFDTQTGKAAIQPEVKSKLSGEFVSLPQINNVPIMFFRAGGFRITMPVKQGDKVLILFTERSIDGWLEDGQNSGPRATHTHNLSDAIAIPGVYPFSDVPPFDSDDTVIGKEDGSVEVRLKPNGEAVIKGTAIKLGSDAASQPFVLGGLLNAFLTSFKTIFDTHTHISAAAGVPTATPLPLSPPLPNIQSAKIDGE